MGRLAIQADGNRAMGAFTTRGAEIDLRIGGVTKRFCGPASLMQPFLDHLDAAISYTIQRGTLAMALPASSGLMIFRPALSLPSATPDAG